jgi:hypothetical protein
MSATAAHPSNATSDASVGKIDMKLEVVTIPVSDVDRAKEFYAAYMVAEQAGAELPR